MTTIATDGKTMAGDGIRVHRDTVVNKSAQKVRRLDDGSLLGTCGDVALGYMLIDWLNGKSDKPALNPETGFSALHLQVGGTVVMYDQHCTPMPVDQLPFAIGSGMDLAIGAMDYGATPEEAVAIAASRDPSTGGMITALTIGASFIPYTPPKLEVA